MCRKKPCGDDKVVTTVREDVWSAVDRSSDWIPECAGVTRPSSTDVKNRPDIPAVEIDPAGCSYNPDHELHQDVIAQAVAAEYSKQIDKELQPKVTALWLLSQYCIWKILLVANRYIDLV